MLGADEKNFENMLILSSGKLFGFFLSFLIPFFLSRWLTIEDYGTYKQLILLWMIFMQIQNFGMDLGLFYFVKTTPVSAPIYSLNVIIANLATTLFTVAILCIFPTGISNILNNQSLTFYIPYFSLVLLFSIPAQHFEHYLVSLDKIKHAFVLEGIQEIVKSCMIIAGFLFFNSLKIVLLLLAFLYLIKLGILIWFNLRLIKRNNIDADDMFIFFRNQLKYGLPLGVARLISAVIYFDKLIISFLYSIAQFTVYSVGCFEIPFVRTVLNTIWDLTAMEMVVANNSQDRIRLISLMRDTMRKISILSIPIAIFCIVFADEIIIFIFSPRYSASVPYFRLFMITFLTNAFDCELLFRVFRENKTFLKIQTLNLFLTLSLMIALGVIYGPLGALAGKVISSILSLLIMFTSVRRRLSLSLSKFVPWGVILWISIFSTFLAIVIYTMLNAIGLKGVFQLSCAGVLYFVSIFFIFVFLGIISSMEKEYFKRKFLCFNKFVKQEV